MWDWKQGRKGGGFGPLGRLEGPLFLPSNSLTAGNKLIIALDMMPTLRFSLKAARELKEIGGHQPTAVCVIYWEDSAIVIWDGSQKRQGSCFFNCSEEQSLITIIEHSGSLQTHLALLIWEQESTKHKFLFCSLRQKPSFFLRLIR